MERNLRRGAELPDDAYEIGGYTRYRKEVWRVTVADAIKDTGTPTHLQHDDIVTDGVERLRVFNKYGDRILIGFPKIKTSTPYQTTL